MTRPLKQIGDEIREMTEEEYEASLTVNATLELTDETPSPS